MSAGEQLSDAQALAKREPSMCRRRPSSRQVADSARISVKRIHLSGFGRLRDRHHARFREMDVGSAGGKAAHQHRASACRPHSPRSEASSRWRKIPARRIRRSRHAPTRSRSRCDRTGTRDASASELAAVPLKTKNTSASPFSNNFGTRRRRPASRDHRHRRSRGPDWPPPSPPTPRGKCRHNCRSRTAGDRGSSETSPLLEASHAPSIASIFAEPLHW